MTVALTTKTLVDAGFPAAVAAFTVALVPTVSVAAPVAVAASRNLTDDDNGRTLETTAAVTLTVPAGLAQPFQCRVALGVGALSVASSGGTLLNGATSTLTRALATNPLIFIQSRIAANSFAVTGV